MPPEPTLTRLQAPAATRQSLIVAHLHIHDLRLATTHLAALTILGLLLILLSRDGRIDFALERMFFDDRSATFPLRDLPLLATYGHTWLKNAVTLAWIACMPLAIASLWSQTLRGWRTALFRFVLFAGVAALIVQTLKGGSAHSCPWDLVQFGGTAYWFPLLQSIDKLAGAGQCWPGGHASAGFALMAGWFAARKTHPRTARIALVLSLFLGGLMGWIQTVRGAHFLTHNLWSLWIVWAVCLAMDIIWHIAATFLPHHRQR